MTCGVCEPQSYRSTPEQRIVGYTPLTKTDERDIHQLYYMGCSYVFIDAGRGPIRYRPKFRLMRKCLRVGDRLIIPTLKALGQDPTTREALMTEIERTAEIFILTPNHPD